NVAGGQRWPASSHRACRDAAAPAAAASPCGGAKPMRMPRFGALSLTLVLLVACTSPTPSQPPASTSQAAATPEGQATGVAQATPVSSGQPSRNLTFGVRYELTGLLDKLAVNTTADSTWRLFNATLSMTDSRGQSLPYLAEWLPQLNTDSWKIFPDGQMETT